MKKIYSVLLIFLFTAHNCGNGVAPQGDFVIRLNQVGYLPDDIKSGIILSTVPLENLKLEIIGLKNAHKKFYPKYYNTGFKHGRYSYTYKFDFSGLKESGKYIISAGEITSYTFEIGENVYRKLTESLLDFFKVQRCGYTDPLLHGVCHIADATAIYDGKDTFNIKMDLTGGWHDAGDYIKFLNTTAYSTYLLLFAYEFAPDKFGFDRNNNNVADILEEAKVGLDWLLRCRYGNKLVTQVQDLRDHDVGWRMPEDDPLTFDRPAFVGIGKNLIGIYSATLALASRIWRNKLNYPNFADTCLITATKYYKLKDSVPDIDSSGSGMYIDKNYEGKLSLAAVELYLSTRMSSYLNEAISFADSAGRDYWWSWGDINAFAHYRLAHFQSRSVDYLKTSLNSFRDFSRTNLFELGIPLSWGTNHTLLGIALIDILYRKLTGDRQYDTLMAAQKDFVLGKNPWGISFIYGFGSKFTTNFHHQISYFKGKLPGGFAAGPVEKKIVDDFKIPYNGSDRLAEHQSSEFYYRDEKEDYITNEPTISSNAVAIFVYGNLSK